MTRLELLAEIQKRSDRPDSTTELLVDANDDTGWINRVRRMVMNSYPFDYLKKSQTASLSADSGDYTLPTDLILHHPFTFRLHSVNSPTTYTRLIKMNDRVLYTWVTSPDSPTNTPEYYIFEGGTNGLVFRLYPVPNETRTLEMTGYYAYADDFDADGDSDWLSENYPDLIIEGVLWHLYEHYEEHERADRSRLMYHAWLYGDVKQGLRGLIPAEKKKARNGRMVRVRTLDDFPVAEAEKLRRLGY